MAEPRYRAIQVSQAQRQGAHPGRRIIGYELRGVGQNLGASEITVSELNPQKRRSSAIRWLTMWWLPTPLTWSSSWISRGRL